MSLNIFHVSAQNYHETATCRYSYRENCKIQSLLKGLAPITAGKVIYSEIFEYIIKLVSERIAIALSSYLVAALSSRHYHEK